MEWERHRAHWPNSNFSIFVEAATHLWHVQQAGRGPSLLLLHGTGASSHSWDGLFQLFCDDFSVTAIDLPGHGFTRIGTKQRNSLTNMTSDIITLCKAHKIAPDYIIGHSAGAAIAMEMSKTLHFKGVIGINAALSKFGGIASWAFPMIAKIIALNPFIPSYLAGLGRNPLRVEKLMRETGSKLSDVQLSRYRALFQDRNHVEGTLLMMAQWNLDRLLLRLDEVNTPTLLIAAERDRTVSPKVSQEISKKLVHAEALLLHDLGHLAHEENPALLHLKINEFIAKTQSGL